MDDKIYVIIKKNYNYTNGHTTIIDKVRQAITITYSMRIMIIVNITVEIMHKQVHSGLAINITVITAIAIHFSL